MSAKAPVGRVRVRSRVDSFVAKELVLENTVEERDSENDRMTNELLQELFKRLNNNNIAYCVLRNYDDLPEKVGNDIDIWVKKNCISQFYDLVEALSREFDYILDYNPRLSLVGEGDYFLIKEWGANFNIIHIDCWTYIHWKGISYIDDDRMEENLTKHRDLFYIPSQGIRASIVLLKDILQGGEVKRKYFELLIRAAHDDTDVFIDAIKWSLGVRTANRVLRACQEGQWLALEKKRNLLRLILFLRSFRNVSAQIRKWMCYGSARFVKYFVRARGIFIVLIGPDGAGKSTTFKGISEAGIMKLFQKNHYFHGQFAYLPRLSVVSSFLRREGKSQNRDSEGSVGKPLNISSAIMYPLYYGLDFFLGHALIWKEKARGNLIVFDRYFYDYSIQPHFSNCPRWLLRVISKLIPRPDIIVFLQNKASVIYGRKRELTVESIERQLSSCENIIKENLDTGLIIETRTPEIVKMELERAIVRKIVEKRVKEV